MSFNSITLVGKAGRDAEVRVTSQGREVASVFVSTSTVNKMIWFKVVGWENVATKLSKIRQGDTLAVQGHLTLDEFYTKSGEKKTDLEVIANHVKRLNPNRFESRSDDSEEYDESETVDGEDDNGEDFT